MRSFVPMHPFRFGITSSRPPAGVSWTDLARRAESLGYATFVMPDHLGDQLSPVGGLAAAAAVTDRIRIGAFVFANDYRHPLLLARETASLDVISSGRAELGIGAGWNTRDYRQLGMSYERAGQRIDRMLESVRLIKRLLAGERVTSDGPWYRLRDAQLQPRPVQAHVPVMIGGGGPRMLRIAAREADIVGLLPQFDAHGRPIISQGTERETARKVAIVREAAGSQAAFERLEINVLVGDAGLIGSGSSPLRSAAAVVKSAAPALVGGSPYVLYGTLAQLRETLLRRRERLGISYYIWSSRLMEELAPLVALLSRA